MYTLDDTTYTTTNFEKVDGKPYHMHPAGIIFHNGGGTVESDMVELTGSNPNNRVSCYIYFCENGTVYELGPRSYMYWHAGRPDLQTKRWWGTTARAYGILHGNYCLGAEAEHRKNTKWEERQLQAMEEWARDMIGIYGFPLTRIGMHKWYAPSRKRDPEDLPDAWLQDWVRGFYTNPGRDVQVIAPAGARIRQAPHIDATVAAVVPHGYVFWSDTSVEGDTVTALGRTSNRWHHFAGPDQQTPNPLGFISETICEVIE